MERQIHNLLQSGNNSMSSFNTDQIHAGYHSAGVYSGPVPHAEIGHVSSGHRARAGRLWSVLEQFFVFLLLLSSMNVITALLPSSKGQPELRTFSADVDRTSVAIDAVIYIFGSILLLMRWRRVLRAARRIWPLPALAIFACLSTIWSVQPAVTLRRSVLLLAATMFAIYIGERYSIKAFAHLLARTLCLMMLMIILLYFVAPEYVVDRAAYGGAWKGLSAYKNTFGEHMAVALLLLVLVRFHRFFWLRYLFILLAAGLLLLSRSATAVICGVLGLAAIPMWRLLRSRQRLLVGILVTMAFSLGIYWLLTFPGFIFQVLGRDPTLTGRTHLWALLFPIMANHPIVGYGYSAFWTGLKAEVLAVWIGAGRLVPVADNGYIDLCLSLGLVGVGLFLYMFVGAFRRAIEYIRSEPGFIGLWPVTYLSIFAADNLCESALLTRGTFPFLVFAILATSLAMHQKHVVAAARTANQPSLWGWNYPVISR